MADMIATEHDLLSQDLDHDAIAAAQSKELLRAGFMEEEFACYGTAFVENGEIKYYISSTERSMNRFVARCIMRNIYPTPPKYYVMRCNVSAGLRDDIRQQFKLDTAYALKRDYTLLYFQAMEELSSYPVDNEAMPILQEIKDEIENTFDKIALEIFRGVVLEALTMKHLTQEGYSYWQTWIDDEYRKMEEDILEYNYYKRTYSGFAYKQNDRIQFVRNAFEMKTIERRNTLIAEGKVVSPILHKDYYAGTYGDLDEGREDFKKIMNDYFNKAFFDYVEALRQLPSAVSDKCYYQWMQRLQHDGKKNDIESLRYHGYLWNVV